MHSGLAAALLFLGLVEAVVVYNLGFKQRAGTEAVTTIRVFFDATQTQELKQGDTISWGKIGSGVWTLPLYVNNTGNVPVILRFSYRGDQLPRGWAEYWDYDGISLAHNELRKVTITLVLPTFASAGVYECDSWISATPVYDLPNFGLLTRRPVHSSVSCHYSMSIRRSSRT